MVAPSPTNFSSSLESSATVAYFRKTRFNETCSSSGMACGFT